MSLSLVILTAAEAWKQKMHPIPFHLNKSGAAMVTEKFPEDGVYLALRRPPRGSLVFSAKGYQSEKHNQQTLTCAVKSTFDQNKYKPVRIGKKRFVELDGVSRLAIEFTTGRGIARKKWVGALVPSPDGGPYGLLVVFGIYIGSSKKPKNLDVLRDPVHKQLSQSFRLGTPEV